MADKDKANGMVPVTVRFAPEVMAAIDDISDRHSVSKAEIIRLGFQSDLIKYLGNVEYVDTNQGAEIRKLFGEICTELSHSRMELNRIGVNYNQEMRLKNIRAKYGNDMSLRMHEENEVMNGVNSVKTEDLERIVNHIDSVMKEAGEALKCILA